MEPKDIGKVAEDTGKVLGEIAKAPFKVIEGFFDDIFDED